MKTALCNIVPVEGVRHLKCLLLMLGLAVGMCSCTERNAFENLKQYLEHHDPQKGPNSEELSQFMSSLWTERGIEFLQQMAKNDNAENAITAHVALGMTVTQGQGSNKDYWTKVKATIDYRSIMNNNVRVKTNTVSDVWRRWSEIAKSDLQHGIK